MGSKECQFSATGETDFIVEPPTYKVPKRLTSKSQLNILQLRQANPLKHTRICKYKFQRTKDTMNITTPQVQKIQWINHSVN